MNEKHHLAESAAAAPEQIVRARNVKALIIVPAPRTLSDLRHAFHPNVKSRILTEINKDLTKKTVAEIEKHSLAEEPDARFLALCVVNRRGVRTPIGVITL